MDRIILASQSPRRKQLLEWACIDFEVIVSEAEEDFPKDLPVAEVPVWIARNKALSVQSKTKTNRIILAADTIVVLDDLIIGKPNDKAEAFKILSGLSGKKHLVVSGVILRQGMKEIAFVDQTEVWFHELSETQIEYYIDNFKPYDKAGAYAIQEWIGVVGIRAIQGDFYNVMGLPISRVIQELNNWH
ncbi:MAG: Maf family nucleotide pyrophosphatase [Chitinophagales bacterium]